MNKIKKVLWWTGLVLLIFLAGTGIGLFGALPVSFKNGKREGAEEINIELVEAPEDKNGGDEYELR